MTATRLTSLVVVIKPETNSAQVKQQAVASCSAFGEVNI